MYHITSTLIDKHTKYIDFVHYNVRTAQTPDYCVFLVMCDLHGLIMAKVVPMSQFVFVTPSCQIRHSLVK